MALLNHGFARGYYADIFGNYTDYLSYVPTNLGKEIDILLMFGNMANSKVASYDIIEVKRAEFDSKALIQLIDYESWFLQKKASGDYCGYHLDVTHPRYRFLYSLGDIPQPSVNTFTK